MSKKLLYTATLFGLFAAALLVFIFSTSNSTGASDYAAKCLRSSPDYVVCLAEESLNQAKKTNIENSLKNLEEHFDTGSYDVRCHSVYHVIGAAFYREFGEKSYINGSSACFGAYYHGMVLETTDLYKDNPSEYSEKLMDFCGIFSKLEFLYCIHGIGHGAYYIADKDTDQAEKICRETPSGIQCAMGLFMEIIQDEDRAAEYGLESFKNFTVESCDIFTSSVLYTACLIQTHISTNIVAGDPIGIVCNYKSDRHKRECRTAYGVGLSGTLLTLYPNHETTGLDSKYTPMLRECFNDTFCTSGFVNSLGGQMETEEQIESYCLNFMENYGNKAGSQRCADRKFFTLI